MLKKVIVILISVFLVGGAAIGFASSQSNDDGDDKGASNVVKNATDDDSDESRVIITAGEAVRIAQGVADGDSDSDDDDDRGNVSSGNRTLIGVDQAVEIVRELFENGKIDDIEIESKRGRLVYEIEVEFNDDDGDVYIDAITGDVIYIEDDIRKYMKTNGNVSTNTSRSDNRSSVTNSTEGKMITAQQAADIALNFLGKGYVDDIELETKNGRLVYEVEVEFGDDDVEVYIDVFTGEIVYVDYD